MVMHEGDKERGYVADDGRCDCGGDGNHLKDEPGDGGRDQGNIDRAACGLCAAMSNLLHAQTICTQRPWPSKLSHA